MDQSFFSMLKLIGTVELIIVFGLLVLSLLLWTIVFLKFYELAAVRRNARNLLHIFEGVEGLQEMRGAEDEVQDCPQRSILAAAFHVLDRRPVRLEVVEEAKGLPGRTKLEELFLLNMQHTAKDYFARMEWGLSFLATLGSTTPFIGLFGTVWGIMTTFRDLGEAKNPSMAVVAPGISSALIATAAGLAVAIPAVIAYNWIMSRIGGLQAQTDAFIERVDLLGRSELRAAETRAK
jgi:biopolymer transport protein TolQ